MLGLCLRVYNSFALAKERATTGFSLLGDVLAHRHRQAKAGASRFACGCSSVTQRCQKKTRSK